MSITIFYCYSHKDEELRDELDNHLRLLQRTGVIVGWHDRRIGAGTEWTQQIDDQLRVADIVLLLISADFLASNYCFDVEMKLALERHERGDAVVIPILLRPVLWEGAPFAHLQALPRDARPVTTWANRDEAFEYVARGIRDAAVARSRASVATASVRAPPGEFVKMFAGAGTDPVPAPPPQERVLDAGLAKKVYTGQVTELLAQIRQADSGGLQAILRTDPDAEIPAEDVRSKPFEVEFPRGPEGRPEPLRVEVRIHSPGFEPSSQMKVILVPVEGDSEVCTFLLTPQRTGRLIAKVEVGWEKTLRASRVIRTECTSQSERQKPSGMTVVSMPLFTIAKGSTSVPGDFTRMFGSAVGAMPQRVEVHQPAEVRPPAPPVLQDRAPVVIPSPVQPYYAPQQVPPPKPAPRRPTWSRAIAPIAAAMVIGFFSLAMWNMTRPSDSPNLPPKSAVPPAGPTLSLTAASVVGPNELAVDVAYDLHEDPGGRDLYLDVRPIGAKGETFQALETSIAGVTARAATARVTMRGAGALSAIASYKVCLIQKPARSGPKWTPLDLSCQILTPRRTSP